MADTKAIEIPPFEATSLDDISAKCARAADTFRTGVTKDVEWRKVQLRKLYWAIVDYTPQLLAALQQDLHKSAYESMLSEINVLTDDCLFLLDQLDRLAADEPLGRPDVPLHFAAAGLRTHKEPLGAVLIVSAYNYPVMLLLSPLIGAVAAGCTAVVKPSEVAPATAMVLRELIETRLDRDAFAVVNGAVPETTALLDFRDTRAGDGGQADGIPYGWAKILYTGGRQVARIVATKAAATLTPVVLELGGRNPAIVTAQADVALAARRLLWGKTLGAGQVCISHNYIMVERSVLGAFIQGLQAAYAQTFPDGSRNSELVHIGTERHFLRLKAMLDETKGRIVLGGQMDQKALFMEPTAVLVDSIDDTMIQQESFGPIFSILPVDSLDQAIAIANRVDPTPLTLFAFGSKAQNARVLREVTSGGATLNDSYMHGSLSSVAFGGVGHSGTGAYRGRHSFDTFTHRRTVAETPGWMERFLRVRYMPYRWSEMRLLTLTASTPRFDRAGVATRGLGYWLRLVVGLGGRGASGALIRWLAVALLAVYAARDNPGALSLILKGRDQK